MIRPLAPAKCRPLGTKLLDSHNAITCQDPNFIDPRDLE